MIEVKISDPENYSVHSALGISEERSNELCELMGQIEDSTRYVNRIEIISSFCNSIEELIFCVGTDMKYLILTGAQPMITGKIG